MNAPLVLPLAPGALAPASWPARLSVGFERRGARTVLASRTHEGPLRLQKALYPEGESICHAIVLHPPSGIAGGDALRVEATVATGAHALLTTPGAGKWYRSNGSEAVMRQHLRVEDDGVLEWLPQENIVFNRAIARLHTEIDLAASARLIATEMTVFGRHGSGERFECGDFTQSIRIRRAGRNVWREQCRMAGGSRLMHSPVGLGDHPVSGTMLAVGHPLDGDVLAACRASTPARGDGAVSLLQDDVLVARYLGDCVEAGRQWFIALWQQLRPPLTGHDACIPRIWNT